MKKSGKNEIKNAEQALFTLGCILIFGSGILKSIPGAVEFCVVCGIVSIIGGFFVMYEKKKNTADSEEKAGFGMDINPKKQEKEIMGIIYHAVPETEWDTKNYIVLDTETTGLDAETDFLLEIGAVKVQNGVETGAFHCLLNPGVPVPAHITEKTGITNEDVKNADKISDIIPKLNEFLSGGFPIIGHYITFDLDFLSPAFEAAGLSGDFAYIDTIEMVKKAYPTIRMRNLDNLIKLLHLLDHPQEHRAMGDVEATHKLYRVCCERLAHPATYPAHISLAQIKPTVTAFNPAHPLYKKKIIFTGDLTIPREEAAQKAVNCGAALREKPSGKTDYIIVGWKDPIHTDEAGMNGKERQALAFNASGKGHIEFLDEAAFMAMLAWTEI